MPSSVSEIYAELILEELIKNLLKDETSPTLSAILSAVKNYSYDTSKPRTNLVEYEVLKGESSSATKMNNTMNAVSRDLTVSYNGLIDVANEATKRFERWRSKAGILEQRLQDLIQRIAQLTLLNEDTAGLVNFVQDNFIDFSKIDKENTTARVDVRHHHVSVGTSTTDTTKYHLLDYIDRSDIQFSVLTKNSIVSVLSSSDSDVLNIFDSLDNYWQERVYTNKPISVSCELKVDLGSNHSISRIDVDVHSASSTSAVEITPLYSVDNKNWSQLPTQNYSLSVYDKATFQFTTVSARYIKFLLRKVGYDIYHKNTYCYEFGFDEISLFNEDYSTSTSGNTLISKPLYITDSITKEVLGFTKLTLEVCELIGNPDTNIEYYITVSNNSSVPVASAQWIRVDPNNRNNPIYPIYVNLSELNFYEKTGVSVSYDPLNTTSKYVNPKRTFTLLSSISGITGTEVTATSSDQRYTFLNPEDRILDFQILGDITFDQSSLELWRNVNTKGSTTLVRGVSNGWGFDGTYYTTTVYVDNSSGVEIDFGSEPAIVDEQKLSGRVTISKGPHSVKVHHNNWVFVDDSLVSDLDYMKSQDPLYPYNHRYLVEGFDYSDAYILTGDERIYRGFDIVAEHLMERVSMIDLVNTVSSTDYSKFALDNDAGDTSRSPASAGTNPTKVFLLKVNQARSDFLNEKFTIRFHPVDAEYNYLRLRAILKTVDTTKTPLLGSYRIKLGGGNN